MAVFPFEATRSPFKFAVDLVDSMADVWAPKGPKLRQEVLRWLHENVAGMWAITIIPLDDPDDGYASKDAVARIVKE